MLKKTVIPCVDLGSSQFNKSSNPYLNLDSQFAVRPAGCPGMTKHGFTPRRHSELVSESSKKGFTLIELLVVVLIIGILSSVAVPQYQVAVDKSRFMTYLQAAHSIRRAEEVYYWANGSYTPDLGALDIDHRTGGTSVTSLKNEWQCPNGSFIDLVSGNSKPYGALKVSLCPDNNTGSGACSANMVAAVTLAFEHFSVPENIDNVQAGCRYRNARGRRICKSLSPDVLN